MKREMLLHFYKFYELSPKPPLQQQPQIIIKIQSGKLSVFWPFLSHFQFGTALLGQYLFLCKLYYQQTLSSYDDSLLPSLRLTGPLKPLHPTIKVSKKEGRRFIPAALQPGCLICLMAGALHRALSSGLTLVQRIGQVSASPVHVEASVNTGLSLP